MNPGLIVGYHGCPKGIADAVISGKDVLHPSHSDYEWLGDGIYCWEDSYQRAYQWAEEQIKKKKIDDTPAVIGVIFKPGNCLDLLDSKCIDILDDFARSINKAAEIAGIELPKNKGLSHPYDCLLINWFHSLMKANHAKPIDTVRAAFMEGKTIGNGASSLYKKSHIQWAICSASSIVGYFRPNIIDSESQS